MKQVINTTRILTLLTRVTLIMGLTLILGACGGLTTSLNPTPQPEWLTYTDSEAGYSFEYRADYIIQAGKNKGERFNHIYINFKFDNENMSIAVLENPMQLPLEQFLKTEHALYYSRIDPAWVKADLQLYAKPLSIADRQVVQIERNDITASLTGRSKYVVYIPHEDRVISVRLGPNHPPVAVYEPHPEATNLFYRILNSFQFFPTKQ